MMLLHIICAFLLLPTNTKSEQEDESLPKITDSIQLGIRLASGFFNSDSNNIISSVFRKLTRKEGNQEQPEIEFVSVLLKTFGINKHKLQDYVLDGFISLTQLMSQVFADDKTPKRTERASKEFSPFEYIIKQPQVIGLLTQMEDPYLVDLVLKEAEGRLRDYPPEDVECIQLLVCKTSPFVRGMQKSLKFFMKLYKIDGEVEKRYKNNTEESNCRLEESSYRKYHEENCQDDKEEELWSKSSLEDRMYYFVPGLDEVIQFGDKCDERFPNCVY